MPVRAIPYSHWVQELSIWCSLPLGGGWGEGELGGSCPDSATSDFIAIARLLSLEVKGDGDVAPTRGFTSAPRPRSGSYGYILEARRMVHDWVVLNAEVSCGYLSYALKEWQVAIDALIQGDLILLLRKGGIREQGGRFQIPHQRVLLYPTYEHQKPELLKSDYASKVQPVATGWHPETVTLQAWAEITHSLPVSVADPIAALNPLHIWNEAFVRDRVQWQPTQPLTVLLLRVFRLTQPQTIPYRAAYGGCRSWIELQHPIKLSGTAVLSEATYGDRVQQVLATLAIEA